jgi:nitroreductase
VEFKEVLGIRRSIRFFDQERPVEREKVQKILEAMRVASCAVNAHWLRAVVVNREDIPPETMEALKMPVAALVQELAPVHIYCYLDLGIVNRIKGTRLRELVDVGALAPTHGWSHKFVDEFVYPQVLQPLTENPAYPVAAAFDCGGAATQGLLTAVDEGLGACWTAFDADAAKALLEIPDDWLPLYVMNLGYSLESLEAGGQRPRPDFEELYFEGTTRQSFRRDPLVVKDLEKEKLYTAPAKSPNPERMKEIREMARKLGLPE